MRQVMMSWGCDSSWIESGFLMASKPMTSWSSRGSGNHGDLKVISISRLSNKRTETGCDLLLCTVRSESLQMQTSPLFHGRVSSVSPPVASWDKHAHLSPLFHGRVSSVCPPVASWDKHAHLKASPARPSPAQPCSVWPSPA